MGIMALGCLIFDVSDGDGDAAGFSSGALSMESKARNCDQPFIASTLVMAAVSVVLP